MGCGASKEAALQALPEGQTQKSGELIDGLQVEGHAVPVSAAPVGSTTNATVAPGAVASITTLASANAADTSAPAAAAAAAAASNAALPTVASKPPSVAAGSSNAVNAEAEARHSAGSHKSALTGASALPAIPPPTTGSAGKTRSSAAELNAPNAPAASEERLKSFEIPLDDAEKVRARKPQSANPRIRRRTQLQPVEFSNEDLQRKLQEAEARWEEDPAAIPQDKDLDPELLKAIVAERETRAAQNRARELEEKRAKLQQHDMHAKEVAERKRLAGNGSNSAINADGIPNVDVNWTAADAAKAAGSRASLKAGGGSNPVLASGGISNVDDNWTAADAAKAAAGSRASLSSRPLESSQIS